MKRFILKKRSKTFHIVATIFTYGIWAIVYFATKYSTTVQDNKPLKKENITTTNNETKAEQTNDLKTKFNIYQFNVAGTSFDDEETGKNRQRIIQNIAKEGIELGYLIPYNDTSNKDMLELYIDEEFWVAGQYIKRTKLEITESLKPNSPLIINNDDDMLNKEGPNLNKKYNLITVGIDNKSTYNATNIEDNIFSSTFYINNDKRNIHVGSKAFIYNSLVAYAVGKILKIDSKDIIEAIAKFKLSPHRLEKKVSKTGITIIDDTYNANQDSMINSLSILSKVKNKRRVAILADILELGNYTKEIHENIGKKIFPNTLDILITVGENAKLIAKEAQKNNFKNNNIYSFKDYKDCLENVQTLLSKNDIVLLKGSHGMNLIKVVEELLKI